ncbi:splicing factor 3B subunit 3-like [Notothenia coriiceps]|uniref:Splicing factor 3B subunit 3-like n=1 Tax=Notothenia coriiceps TaxID=8208 RepID=A0A6I9P3U4_9TELE|nr:PREDICTED: splicing factor 3B subunit 3-like [Notothenia coriiceps]
MECCRNQTVLFRVPLRYTRGPKEKDGRLCRCYCSGLRLKDHNLTFLSLQAEVIMNYHVGETVLSIQKTTLIPGGSESMVYTTLSGGIGILVPFTSHEDHDFFQHLEMHMRSEFPPLCGRDHLSFRSYYFPVKNVIDGDLCEQFNSMDPHKQKSVAEELDRTPPEVSKKLEDIRTRYAF